MPEMGEVFHDLGAAVLFIARDRVDTAELGTPGVFHDGQGGAQSTDHLRALGAARGVGDTIDTPLDQRSQQLGVGLRVAVAAAQHQAVALLREDLLQAALRQIAADWTLTQYIDHMLLELGPRFTPQDVYVAELLGAIEAIDAGVTTVMDWAHIMRSPVHADEAVRGLRDSGIRAVFGYGNPGGPPAEWYAGDVRRVAERYFSSDFELVTFALASMGPEFGAVSDTAADLELARELGIRASMHVGVGTLGKRRSITEVHRRGLLGPDLIYVHCNTCNDAELQLIAETGGHASISPRVEMQMGRGYPATGRLHAAGVATSLSIDVVSGVEGKPFRGDARHAQGRERLAASRRTLPW
ncbi:hypothetical protein OJ963_41570 [Streptomyces sp. RS2]|nr:hypothetical protein [Streptomyces sp. RS2]MCW1100254.1 hypothetical protein [Streptomyces sp. RS2]